jgi:hypothetical protein
MNMYIAQVREGALEIVTSLGVVDPDEPTVPHSHTIERTRAVAEHAVDRLASTAEGPGVGGPRSDLAALSTPVGAV